MWECTRCCKKFDDEVLHKEFSFTLCQDCKSNHSIQKGEYRWALVLIDFYMQSRNAEVPLPNFWPKNPWNENLIPNEITKKALGS